jgi:type VI secretion system protein ImpA
MRFDFLKTPINDAEPCGEDLELLGDDAYIDYYYDALARVPERFLVGGQPFDRKEIDVKSESKEIEALLKTTYDLRLLGLDAKFQALGGSIKAFSESVCSMDFLLTEYWEHVHPKIDGGNVTERRNQIELLDDRSTIVMPLEHSPLFRDRRLDNITYRDYQVASGKKDARDGENVPDASSIISAVKSAENAEQVEKLFGDLKSAQDAIKSIDQKCKTSDGQPFAPSLDNIEAVLKELIGFLTEARPDLATDGDATSDGDGEDGEVGEDGTPIPAGEGGSGSATMVSGGPPVAVGPILNHAHAKAALEAVERYFAQIEPSSPGLILIKQAILLIGKPLTVALEVLLPNVAEQARIDFGSENGFNMTIPRMKMLAENVGETGPSAGAELPDEPVIVENRDQASAMISNVETFFRQTEPSSPVPILLFKAKTFLNRDFSAIINDLFAHVPSKP